MSNARAYPGAPTHHTALIWDPGPPHPTRWDPIMEAFKTGRKGLSQLVAAFEKWGEVGPHDAVLLRQVSPPDLAVTRSWQRLGARL